jgi:hypothetical protein
MNFFETFPFGTYQLGDHNRIVRDIMIRTGITEKVKTDIYLFDSYRIQDHESPEMVSYKFYGTTNYHWIILVTNDIIDPQLDWPMDSTTFQQYIEDKYTYLDDITSRGYEKIKHWEDSLGFVVLSTEPGAYPISHQMWEERINTDKRMIKIPRKEIANDIMSELEKILA